MTLSPLLDASIVVQVHVAMAVPAVLLGPVVLFRARRDRLHRFGGYGWVTAMAGLAATGLLIPGGFAVVGPFGPIHLLSLVTLAGLFDGVRKIRRGDVAGHRRTMRQVWFGALGLAGLFTLVPGRLMHAVLLGGDAVAGWAALAVGLGGLALLWRLRAGRAVRPA